MTTANAVDGAGNACRMKIVQNGLVNFGLFHFGLQAGWHQPTGLAMEKSIYTREYGLLLETLRSSREAAGLTQVELASRLSVTQTFVSKCERGERRLDVIELRSWCSALGISLGDFAAQLEEAFSASAAGC